MRFTFEGLDYRIGFRHEIDRKSETAITYCWVDNVDRSVLKQVVGKGSAKCSKGDIFNKETGRKLALERALVGKVRAFRTAAWKAYFNRITEAKAPAQPPMETLSSAN
jgi:hypothetical protein